MTGDRRAEADELRGNSSVVRDRRAQALERLDEWERDATNCLEWSQYHWPPVPHYANFGPDVTLGLIEGLRAVLESSDPDDAQCPFPRILTNAILGDGGG